MLLLLERLQERWNDRIGISLIRDTEGMWIAQVVGDPPIVSKPNEVLAWALREVVEALGLLDEDERST